MFDLDGTLIDSSLDLCLSVNAAMAHVGAAELPHERITGYIGDGAATLVRRALGQSDGSQPLPEHRLEHQERFKRAFSYFLAYYREHKLDNTKLYPGVLNALHEIGALHPSIPMAVLTNKPVNPSRQICEGLGLKPYLFAIYGGDSFPEKKPDPVGLLTLMSEARALWGAKGVSVDDLLPKGVVMVGDSEVDVLTAKRAGAGSLGCRYGLAPYLLERSCPDLLCGSPDEWPALLKLRKPA